MGGQEITFGPTIQPACLPNQADDFTGQTCWAAGWGNIKTNGHEYPNELREVDVEIFPQDYCINKYNTAYGSGISTLLTCSALVKKREARTLVKVTLVDHSSVPRTVNPLSTALLHGALVVLKLNTQASTLQSRPLGSTDGSSHTWAIM